MSYFQLDTTLVSSAIKRIGPVFVVYLLYSSHVIVIRGKVMYILGYVLTLIHHVYLY